MSQSTRGKLYIDKDVQRALLWQLFRHWTLFVVLLAGMLLALESLQAPQRSLLDLAGALCTRQAPLLLVIASLFPVFAYDSIKLSHRFVGPIVRLRSALRAVAAGGSVQPLQFRKGDFWQDMADSFNTVAERLEAQADRPEPSAPREPASSAALELVGAAPHGNDFSGA